MTLTHFLVGHLQRMQRCFVIEHFEISILGVKRIGGIFDILVDYEYLDAVIRYGHEAVALWNTGKREELVKALVHECSHCLTGSVTDGMKLTKHQRKLDEQANEHLSRLLYRLYRRRK